MHVLGFRNMQEKLEKCRTSKHNLTCFLDCQFVANFIFFAFILLHIVSCFPPSFSTIVFMLAIFSNVVLQLFLTIVDFFSQTIRPRVIAYIARYLFSCFFFTEIIGERGTEVNSRLNLAISCKAYLFFWIIVQPREW